MNDIFIQQPLQIYEIVFMKTNDKIPRIVSGLELLSK